MHYKVISENNSRDFTTNVNTALEEGYTLQGGVSISTDGKWRYYAQALIKEIEAPEGGKRRTRRRRN